MSNQPNVTCLFCKKNCERVVSSEQTLVVTLHTKHVAILMHTFQKLNFDRCGLSREPNDLTHSHQSRTTIPNRYTYFQLNPAVCGAPESDYVSASMVEWATLPCVLGLGVLQTKTTTLMFRWSA